MSRQKWDSLVKSIEPITLTHDAVRIVESQSQVATTRITDTLDEQFMLEQLLEETKPPLPGLSPKFHYLLSTPFRYPPLKHGSRFGTILEPSLFYASHEVYTVLAEAAYYRQLFINDMDVMVSDNSLKTRHTVFGLRYYVENGLQLQSDKFKKHESVLISKDDYNGTQTLGQAMRDYGIGGFEYISARDMHKGINIALFTPEGLDVNEPLYQDDWLCETRIGHVIFSNRNMNTIHYFDDFD